MWKPWMTLSLGVRLFERMVRKIQGQKGLATGVRIVTSESRVLAVHLHNGNAEALGYKARGATKTQLFVQPLTYLDLTDSTDNRPARINTIQKLHDRMLAFVSLHKLKEKATTNAHRKRTHKDDGNGASTGGKAAPRKRAARSAVKPGRRSNGTATTTTTTDANTPAATVGKRARSPKAP
jgi:hypothetical protein